jgi:hypothetical protein
MSLRALVTADVHAYNNLPFAKIDRETGYSDRLRDVISVLDQMKTYAVKNCIHDIFILGDLFDKRMLDGVTLPLVVETVARMAKNVGTVHIMGGNHEATNAQADHYTTNVFATVPNVRVISGAQKIEGISFWALPYKPEKQYRETLEDMTDEFRAIRGEVFLLIHQAVYGARVGSWLCPDGIRAEELSPYAGVLAGDFHTHQEFLPDMRGYYVGAPLQHNFGDAGENRGVWDVTFGDDNSMVSKFVPIESPKFHVWQMGFGPDGFEADDAPDVMPNDYVQIVVHCAGDKSADKEAQVEEIAGSTYDIGVRLVKVRWSMERVHKKRLAIAKDKAGVISLPTAMQQYVEHNVFGGMDKQKLIDIGLAALRSAGGGA